MVYGHVLKKELDAARGKVGGEIEKKRHAYDVVRCALCAVRCVLRAVCCVLCVLCVVCYC